MNYKNVKIAEGARIARQSVIVGDVTIGRDSCVLYYAVIRGDDAPVVIGEETNIQENCTIHVSHNMPTHIGNNVTIGHNAVVHGCTIGDRTLIGMGAVLLDGAKIGSDCIIGAGSLVTKNTVIPDGSLVMGNLMLAAADLGVDSCWIHRAKEEFESEEGKAILKDLGITGDYEGIGHCVLGYAANEVPEAAPRKDNYVYYAE